MILDEICPEAYVEVYLAELLYFKCLRTSFYLPRRVDRFAPLSKDLPRLDPWFTGNYPFTGASKILDIKL